ncbi:MAG: pentapeptide repeat-containing protein [Marmoricola sp.]|nr:pentapeptide repeat-containing protein [Marmoricola sp.]
MRFPFLIRVVHTTVWIAAPIAVVAILALESQRSGLTGAAVALGLIVALLAGWHLGAGLPRSKESDWPVTRDDSSPGGVAGDSAVLAGADLRGADLTGADLRGVDLRGANLTRAILREANLRGARLADGATGSGTDSGSGPRRLKDH